MNLPGQLLGDFWYWLAWGLWLPLMGLALRLAPWRRFKNGNFLNVWLGMIVVLILIWSMKAGIKPGLDLHLTGIMLFYLLFDLPLAFIGLNLVLLGITLNGSMDCIAFALNGLIMAGLGSGFSFLIRRGVDYCFPRHFFVFVFLKGFFGAALVVMGIGLTFSLLYGVNAIYSWDYLLEEYLPYYLLLGFSEAWISGMVLTLMLVYRPEWVSSFDGSIDLGDK